MGDWKELGMSTAGGAINGALGLALQPIADKRQINQQKKLTNIQESSQKRLGDYNQQLALDMWEKTNYEAQTKQMRKAGLNVGLMYGGSGAGGTTQGGQAGSSVAGGQAPQGGHEIQQQMAMGLEREMIQANIRLANSQAKKNEADTVKTSGADTDEVRARIENLGAQTNNAIVQKSILNWTEKMWAIDVDVASRTKDSKVVGLTAQWESLFDLGRTIEAQADVDVATKEEIIKQAGLKTAEMTLTNALIKANTGLTEAQNKKIAEDVMRLKQMTAIDWYQVQQKDVALDQESKKIIMEAIRTEFSSGDVANVLRIMNGVTKALGDVADAVGTVRTGMPKRKIGF